MAAGSCGIRFPEIKPDRIMQPNKILSFFMVNTFKLIEERDKQNKKS
jgi:hypothetical protein